MKVYSMNAYEAMNAILDINETVDKIKDENRDNVPNLVSCKAVELLVQYRQLLCAEMQKTQLGVFDIDDE